MENKEIEQTLVNLTTGYMTQQLRFEALLRYLMDTRKITSDDILNYTQEYLKFQDYFKVFNSNPKLVERINSAIEYNSKSENFIKFQADDLNIQTQIEASGGTSEETIKLILSLPHSKRLENILNKYKTEEKVIVEQKWDIMQEHRENVVDNLTSKKIEPLDPKTSKWVNYKKKFLGSK